LVTKKRDKDVSFVCDDCRKNLDLTQMYIRDKKLFCPECYGREYKLEDA
jgi:Zn finger protein HypA/HybF involved in hydrogenase expression